MTDDELVGAFETATLPPELFSHAAHVRVAWWYMRRHGLSGAADRFRDALRRFAAKLGAEHKYHETITVAYLLLIAERLGRSPDAPWEAFAAAHPIGPQDPQPSGASAYLPAEDDVEMRYALALSVARRGDLDSAIATLTALTARSPQGDLGAHVASDLERMRLFHALRAKLLAGLAESGGELRLEIKGREITFVVQTIEPVRIDAAPVAKKAAEVLRAPQFVETRRETPRKKKGLAARAIAALRK